MSSLSTSSPYGPFSRAAQVGGGAPPLRDGVVQLSSGFISELSSIQSRNGRAIWCFVGSFTKLSTSTNAFSLNSFKSQMDSAAAQTSAQQMGNFVKAGTLVAALMLDDIEPGSAKYTTIPTLQQVEDCAAYSKSKWSLVPTCVRARNSYLRGFGSFTSLDFGWGQWINSRGPAQAYYQNQVNDGKVCKLGFMAGFNLLNGGSGTAPWNQHPMSASQFGMSPAEITACASAFAAVPECIGMMLWQFNNADGTSDYYDDPLIQAALQNVANAASGRSMGPINQRTSADTSGTTVTGDWAFTGVGTAYKTNDATSNSPGIPANVVAGSLLGIVAYSRDSGRTPVCPSNYSEAKRVSGLSSKGGELAVFYKIAGANEVAPVVSYTSVSAITGTAQITFMFAFTGNSQTTAGLLSISGSSSTWGYGSSNMGPVRGLTPADSGGLCVIVAAKTNDLNSGDPPPNATMSATTGDSITWQRGTLISTAAGADASLLMDYAFLTGTPSITTKSWTQDSGAGSSTSGAGNGFMLVFKPATVVTGTAPSIAPVAQDNIITMQVTDTLSFTFGADGDTPITWDLDDEAPATAALVAGTGAFSWATPVEGIGSYPITVTATNAAGEDSYSFTINVVSGSNTAPVITSPGNQSVRAQDILSLHLTVTDAQGDPLAYGMDQSPLGAVISDEGQFVWRPTGDQGPGSYPVVFTASDGLHESRSTITVTVTDVPWTKPNLSALSRRFGRASQAPSQFSRVR